MEILVNLLEAGECLPAKSGPGLCNSDVQG